MSRIKKVQTAKEKRDALAQQMAKTLGQSIEEVYKLLPPVEEIEVVPTKAESMFQAQSALLYFKSAGHGFVHRQCKICKRMFAYGYPYFGITMCSVECMKKSLEEIGLSWHPEKPLKDRWGPYMPAVVPPEVLELLPPVKNPEMCPKWLAQKEKEEKSQNSENQDNLDKSSAVLPDTSENNISEKEDILQPSDSYDAQEDLDELLNM